MPASNPSYPHPRNGRYRMHRVRRLIDRFASSFPLRRLGDPHVAYFIVLVLAVAGSVTTGLATKLCEWEDPPPVIDSNFWSNCSQVLIGLGGIYIVIIPILQKAKIKIRAPKLFAFLLFVAFITGVGGIITFPFHGRAGIVLGFISSLAQLLSALLLIESQSETIGERDMSIERLEHELVQYREAMAG